MKSLFYVVFICEYITMLFFNLKSWQEMISKHGMVTRLFIFNRNLIKDVFCSS